MMDSGRDLVLVLNSLVSLVSVLVRIQGYVFGHPSAVAVVVADSQIDYC